MIRFHRMKGHGRTITSGWRRFVPTGFIDTKTHFVEAEIYNTGNSYFATITTAEESFTNRVLGIVIKKHFPFDKGFSLWDAKRWVRFMVENVPDYADNWSRVGEK